MPLADLGFHRDRRGPSRGALLYRNERHEYLRLDIDDREGQLLMTLGVGDGSPPHWSVAPGELHDFPLDFVLEDLGVSLEKLESLSRRHDFVGMAREYVSLLQSLGAAPELTHSMVDALRAKAAMLYEP